MIYYVVTTRPSSVIDGQGMIEGVGTFSDSVSILIEERNREKFEKLLEGNEDVLEYRAVATAERVVGNGRKKESKR